MKVHPGTIDIVTSPGWKVPFQDVNDVPSPMHNTTETIHNWERILTVHLVPGLDIHEESDLSFGSEKFYELTSDIGLTYTNGFRTVSISISLIAGIGIPNACEIKF